MRKKAAPCVQILLLWILLLSPAQAEEKVDPPIGNDGRVYPVFVRFADQLLPGAGDLARFCKKNSHRRRSDLKKEVTSALQRKASLSWRRIEKLVTRLKREKKLSHVVRFWIVGGFACEATGSAAHALGKHQAVSFVYLQRLAPQHKGPLQKLPPNRLAKRKKLFEQTLAGWKDDSSAPLPFEKLKIPWNLKRVQADQVWQKEKITGRGVVIALLDSGILPHPSLTNSLWRNKKEKLNNRDDDGNGYVDDIFGWDFLAGNPYVIGDRARMPHGSICAGIMAGRPAPEKWIVTGIAPRARIMVLRGAGFLSYEYALTMGADIISMSYMWVKRELGHYRGLYRMAHDHLTAAGILAVGGAGNFAKSAPKGRQIALPKDIPSVLAVAGILKNGIKAPASSEGPCTWQGVKFYNDYPPEKPLAKPDVTGLFGGFPCWCVTKNLGRRRWRIHWAGTGGVGLVIGPQGNSFAGPHGGGVAALVFSANPELKAWEVKEILETTALDIGKKGRDYQFGAGLIQALPAVQAAKKRRTY